MRGRVARFKPVDDIFGKFDDKEAAPVGVWTQPVFRLIKIDDVAHGDSSRCWIQ